MADYYSRHDPHRGAGESRLDYDTGSTGRWIWAALILVAVVGLIALGSIGAGDGNETAPAAAIESPAGADAPAARDNASGAEVVPTPDASLGAENPAAGEAQPAPPAPAE